MHYFRAGGWVLLHSWVLSVQVQYSVTLLEISFVHKSTHFIAWEKFFYICFSVDITCIPFILLHMLFDKYYLCTCSLLSFLERLFLEMYFCFYEDLFGNSCNSFRLLIRRYLLSMELIGIHLSLKFPNKCKILICPGLTDIKIYIPVQLIGINWYKKYRPIQKRNVIDTQKVCRITQSNFFAALCNIFAFFCSFCNIITDM